ncbi:MAG: SecDF P1 head subdomain-containing protein, partial [Vitreimonas sp.]
PRARRALEDAANATLGAPDTLAYLERQNGWIEARLPYVVTRDATRLAVAQSVQVISRRLNPTGALPILVSGTDEARILIEARGENSPERLRSLIGPTGRLTFNLVREAAPGDIDTGRIPAGAFLAAPYGGGDAAPALVERRPRFTGERIVAASPSRDPRTGRRVLSIQLDAEGARQLCRVTRDHAGARFAMLIDDRVVAAPTISAPVCGGVGRIGGDFSETEAARLAALLRAGALPAPLILIEEGLRPPS